MDRNRLTIGRSRKQEGRRDFSSDPSSFFLLPSFLFLLLFYFYPLGAILYESFLRADTITAPFVRALTSASVWRTFGFTVYQAALSTLLTLLVGLPGAYVLARYRFPGQGL